MADSELECSAERSGMNVNIVLKTPEKEDSQKYSQTPVSSIRRRTMFPLVSTENKQGHTTSSDDKEISSYSAESREKIYQKSNLDKIRVSLFHNMEQKNKEKAQILAVDAASFYGNSESRFLPLAPNILDTLNKRIDKCKTSPSLYDFSNKRGTRKRKGDGAINSGVGHGIKKLKSKANSIKHELSEIDDDISYKLFETSKKENVEIENSQDIEDYNPNKKFFKYKRPEIFKITVGKKPKQKKNEKQEETRVNYSNIFDSLNSKKQFYKQLNISRSYSSSEAASTFVCSSPIIKKETCNQNRQHQQSTHHSSNSGHNNLRTENNVDESFSEDLPYENSAKDIENINFNNNEMMIDVNNRNDEESKHQLAVGNLFSIESLVMDDSLEQNDFEKENSTESGKLNTSIDSKQFQKNDEHGDVKVCQKSNSVYEHENKNQEMAHSNDHNGFCYLQFEGWTEGHTTEIIGTNRRIVIVKPYGPESHKKKVFDVLRVINKQLGLFDDNLMENIDKKYVFIYIREKSIIGILVAEYLDYAFTLESNSSGPSRISSEIFPVKCGVNAIWVSKNYRRQGIATKMMDCLQNRFFSNYRMNLNDIAFSISTISGKYFAEKYVGSCDLKVF